MSLVSRCGWVSRTPSQVFRGEKCKFRIYLFVLVREFEIVKTGLLREDNGGDIEKSRLFDEGSVVVLHQPGVTTSVVFNGASFAEVGEYKVGVRFRHWETVDGRTARPIESTVGYDLTVVDRPSGGSKGGRK